MAAKRFADNPLGPASHFSPVTPADGAPLTAIPRALFVGVGGDVTLRSADDPATDVLFKNVQSGQQLDVQASYVKATGTTATNIVALF